MKKYILILTIGLGQWIFGQKDLKNFYPKEIVKVDLSEKKQKEIDRMHYLNKRKYEEKNTLSKGQEMELEALLKKYGEAVGSVWDVIEGGCSWYCGGGNYEVKSSSSLGKNYKTENANDLSYKTAWVEGKKGSGIGEYLEYYFKNESPRLNKVIVSNGYMKTDETWENNNRVKKLKMYVNHKPFGILNLENSKTDQYFEVGILGRNKDGSDLVLKFEILEVYKGKKYDDTAITEIYFDGIDVH